MTKQTSPPTVRLPVPSDVLPPQLALRLLSEADPSEVSTIAAARVAGHSAAGLRLRPNDPQSTVEHVDVWADASTGVPLRVAVYVKGSSAAVLTTSFLDFALSKPSESDIAFTPSDGVKISVGTQPDLASAISQFSHAVPPQTLAGVARNDDLPQFGAVGLYGRGVTEFAASPLPRGTATSLRKQFALAPGVTSSALGLSGNIGGISLVLTDPPPGQRTWLLTGTVTTALLDTAAAGLPTRFP